MYKQVEKAHGFINKNPFGAFILICTAIVSFIYLPTILSGKMYIFLDIGADTYSSYWPRYAFAWEYFRTYPISGWSHTVGLGANITTFIQFLYDPFNLFIIPFNKDNIDVGIFLALMAKVYTLAILAYLFLFRLGMRGGPLVIASLCYTFCGYFVGWGQHYNFATMFVLFTLCMYHIEGWFLQGKWLGLVIAIGLLGAYTPYNTYMSFIFFPVYFSFRYFSLFSIETWRNYIHKGLTFICLCGLGVALSAYSFLPQTYTLLQSPRVGGSLTLNLTLAPLSEYYTIFMRFFANSILGVDSYRGFGNFYESPFLYTGIIMFFALPSLVYAGIRKRAYLLAFAICLFILLFPGFTNVLFNGFSSYTYRWTFILVPVFSIATARGLSFWENDELSKRWIYILITGLCLIPCGLAIFSKVPIRGFVDTSIPFSVKVIFITAFAYGIVFGLLPVQDRPLKELLILLIVVFELAATGCISVNIRNLIPGSQKSQLPYFDAATNAAIRKIQATDQSFYRINKYYDYIELTDALFQNFHGEKFYSSVIPVYFWDMEKAFGLRGDHSNYFFGFDDKQSLRDVSAGKYLLSHSARIYAGYQSLAQFGSTHIYENMNALPLAFTYKSFISQADFLRLDITTRNHIVYDAVVISEADANKISDMKEIDGTTNEPYLIPVTDMAAIENAQEIERNFSSKVSRGILDDFPEVWLQFGQPSTTSLALSFVLETSQPYLGRLYYKTDGADYDKADFVYIPIKAGRNEYSIIIPAVGVDGVLLDLSISQADRSIEGLAVYSRNDRVISEKVEVLREPPVRIEQLTEDYIRVSVTTNGEGLIYFSIPYDEGWKLLVDGEPAEMIRANFAFMTILVHPGNHRVELQYSPPWSQEGLVISVSAIVSILMILLRELMVSQRRYIAKEKSSSL